MVKKSKQLVKVRARRRLTKSARKTVTPVVKEIKALIHAHALFVSSFKMADDLLNNIEGRDVWARHASTRAIMVEYGKPWSGNKDQYLRHFKSVDGYLGSLLEADEHKELCEMRNRFAAHTDGGVQPVAVAAMGARVENGYPNDHRYDEVFLTVRVRSESAYALGFKDADIVERYKQHIEAVMEATGSRLIEQMKLLHVHLVRFAPVMDEIADMVGLLETVNDGAGQRVPDVTEGPSFTDPIAVTIGSGEFRTVLGRVETSNRIDPKLSTTGLAIDSTTSADGKVDYQVSFMDIDLTKVDDAEAE